LQLLANQYTAFHVLELSKRYPVPVVTRALAGWPCFCNLHVPTNGKHQYSLATSQILVRLLEALVVPQWSTALRAVGGTSCAVFAASALSYIL